MLHKRALELSRRLENAREILASLRPESSGFDELVESFLGEKSVRTVSESGLLSETVPTRRVLEAIRSLLGVLSGRGKYARVYYENFGTGKSHTLALIRELSELASRGELSEYLEPRARFRLDVLAAKSEESAMLSEILAALSEPRLKPRVVVLDGRDMDEPLYAAIPDSLGLGRPRDRKDSLARIQAALSEGPIVILVDELQAYYATVKDLKEVDNDVELVKALAPLNGVFMIISANRVLSEDIDARLSRIFEKLSGAAERPEFRSAGPPNVISLLKNFSAAIAAETGSDPGFVEESRLAFYDLILGDENLLRNAVRVRALALAVHAVSGLSEDYRFFPGLLPAGYLKKVLSDRIEYLEFRLALYDMLLEKSKLREACSVLIKGLLATAGSKESMSIVRKRFKSSKIFKEALRELEKLGIVSVVSDEVSFKPLPKEYVEIIDEFVRNPSKETLVKLFRKIEIERIGDLEFSADPFVLEKKISEFVRRKALNAAREVFGFDAAVEVSVNDTADFVRGLVNTVKEVIIGYNKKIVDESTAVDVVKGLKGEIEGAVKKYLKGNRKARIRYAVLGEEGLAMSEKDLKRKLEEFKKDLISEAKGILAKYYNAGEPFVSLEKLAEELMLAKGRRADELLNFLKSEVIKGSLESVDFVDKISAGKVIFKRSEKSVSRFYEELEKLSRKSSVTKSKLARLIQIGASEGIDEGEMLGAIKSKLGNLYAYFGGYSYKPLVEVSSLDELKEASLYDEKNLRSKIEKALRKEVEKLASSGIPTKEAIERVSAEISDPLAIEVLEDLSRELEKLEALTAEPREGKRIKRIKIVLEGPEEALEELLELIKDEAKKIGVRLGEA